MRCMRIVECIAAWRLTISDVNSGDNFGAIASAIAAGGFALMNSSLQ
jgi:hypothetical protein